MKRLFKSFFAVALLLAFNVSLRAETLIEDYFPSPNLKAGAPLGGSATISGGAEWFTSGGGGDWVGQDGTAYLVPSVGSEVGAYVPIPAQTAASVSVTFNQLNPNPTGENQGWVSVGFITNKEDHLSSVQSLGLFITKDRTENYVWAVRAAGKDIATGPAPQIVDGAPNTLTISYNSISGTVEAVINEESVYSGSAVFKPDATEGAGISSVGASPIVTGIVVNKLTP